MATTGRSLLCPTLACIRVRLRSSPGCCSSLAPGPQPPEAVGIGRQVVNLVAGRFERGHERLARRGRRAVARVVLKGDHPRGNRAKTWIEQNRPFAAFDIDLD